MRDPTSSSRPPLKIGYVLLRFPKLTETFIAEEITALRTSGVTIDIVSLLRPWREAVQPISRELLGVTWYAPAFAPMRLIGAQFHFFLRSPGLYVRLLAALLRQPYPKRRIPMFVRRVAVFAKAVASARHLKGRDLQVLHAHFAWLAGAAAWVIARLIGVPYTVTVHAFDLYRDNELLPLVCSGAARVVTISDFNRREIVRRRACADDKITIIRCGIDRDRFRSERGISPLVPPEGTLRILSVGSLLPKKGHADLLAACVILRQRGIDFRCTVIGAGPEENRLRNIVREGGLEDRVRLAGSLVSPDVLAEYGKHDVFALACLVAPDGDSDGIPVVLMEAGAMGLPLVSTNVSGIPELVQHGRTGLLVPPSRPDAFAEALATLARDPHLRLALGKNARALIEQDYDITRNAGRLRELFISRVAGFPATKGTRT